MARGGDEAAFKTQVGETAKACKACHDKYREQGYESPKIPFDSLALQQTLEQ
ncbi:MAG TPA: cytochrome c [Candidatus Competibacteraceae bacterium]|nr:cytochrome c [Candidatus Competibacteraceae bacterium]